MRFMFKISWVHHFHKQTDLGRSGSRKSYSGYGVKAFVILIFPFCEMGAAAGRSQDTAPFGNTQ